MRPLCQASDTGQTDTCTWKDRHPHRELISGSCSLTGQGHSCSGWELHMGSCWWSRRGRRCPGCTGAPGARLAGRARSPASQSCLQYLRAGRGPWSGPGRLSPPGNLQCAHLCTQSCSKKSPVCEPQWWRLPGSEPRDDNSGGGGVPDTSQPRTKIL